MNVLPSQIRIEQFHLLSDWIAASINFLQNDLHHASLSFSEHLHFPNGFFVHSGAMRDRWWLETMDDSIGVLILPFLKMSLNLLGVVRLKAIWLQLESLVKILQILNVILDCLRALLLNSRGASQPKCLPT